jgi:hypothetical protein
MFDEYSEKGAEIQRFIDHVLVGLSAGFNVKLKEPSHDIARRFLNEIVEFRPAAGDDYNDMSFLTRKEGEWLPLEKEAV